MDEECNTLLMTQRICSPRRWAAMGQSYAGMCRDQKATCGVCNVRLTEASLCWSWSWNRTAGKLLACVCEGVYITLGSHIPRVYVLRTEKKVQ